MEPSLIQILVEQTIYVLAKSARWMSWNLFLAIVPLVLSFFLFRRSRLAAVSIVDRHRSVFWWVGAAVFLAFLPNAPYILTDIIHFIRQVQIYPSAWFIALVLVPLYVLFLAAGFEAYVLSLINVGHYLRQNGLARYILPMELGIHALSAIGIYLGRFLRFNSWDLITRLHSVTNSVVDGLTSTEALLAMMVTFFVLAGLHALVKPLNLAMFAYLKSSKSPRLIMEQS
jgi:uncharacterized membrane protein